MSAFFDRFEELCRARGETPNSGAKKLGIPSGSITAWKKGNFSASALSLVNKARFKV